MRIDESRELSLAISRRATTCSAHFRFAAVVSREFCMRTECALCALCAPLEHFILIFGKRASAPFFQPLSSLAFLPKLKLRTRTKASLQSIGANLAAPIGQCRFGRCGGFDCAIEAAARPKLPRFKFCSLAWPQASASKQASEGQSYWRLLSRLILHERARGGQLICMRMHLKPPLARQLGGALERSVG